VRRGDHVAERRGGDVAMCPCGKVSALAVEPQVQHGGAATV